MGQAGRWTKALGRPRPANAVTSLQNMVSRQVAVVKRGRRFNPLKPWPTANQGGRRILALVATVASVQFALNALQLYMGTSFVTRRLMAIAWMVAGALVATATIVIESYLLRKQRLSP